MKLGTSDKLGTKAKNRPLAGAERRAKDNAAKSNAKDIDVKKRLHLGWLALDMISRDLASAEISRKKGRTPRLSPELLKFVEKFGARALKRLNDEERSLALPTIARCQVLIDDFRFGTQERDYQLELDEIANQVPGAWRKGLGKNARITPLDLEFIEKNNSEPALVLAGRFLGPSKNMIRAAVKDKSDLKEQLFTYAKRVAQRRVLEPEIFRQLCPGLFRNLVKDVGGMLETLVPTKVNPLAKPA